MSLQKLCSAAAVRNPTPLSIEASEIALLPLFDGVETAIVNHLAGSFIAQQYRSGSILLEQGEMVSCYCIITRGIVELVRTTGEHQFGVLLLSTKDLMMPSAATFDEPTLVTVRALTTTRTLEIDAPTFRAALEESPRLSMNLMKAMSGQWRMLVRNILDLNSRTAAQRLGCFLLRLADLQDDGVSPFLPIPKRHLASRLGITPETLSRTLQTVADRGLHLRGRAIIVRDRSTIQEFCGPDPYERPDERPLSVFAF